MTSPKPRTSRKIVHHAYVEEATESDNTTWVYVDCDPDERIDNPKYSKSWDDVTCKRCIKMRKQEAQMTHKPLDLERIKAYCKAASPAPWSIPPSPTRMASDFNVSGNGEWRVYFGTGKDKRYAANLAVVDGRPLKANAWFIAQSRTDLPACVEEIALLRRALEEIEGLTGGTGTVGIIARIALGR